MSLINTLKVIVHLEDGPASMAVLEELTGLSRRQVMRHIADARDLGADIQTNNHGPHARWFLVNAEAVTQRGLARRWLELESQRNV